MSLNSQTHEKDLRLLQPHWYENGIITLDLTVQNEALSAIDLGNAKSFQAYTEAKLAESHAKLAIGKWAENRNIYTQAQYLSDEPRSVHLGLDLNLPEGTPLFLPEDGEIYGFADNNAIGDYGPTIIFKHKNYYSLFGHLSRESLKSIRVKDKFKAGNLFAHVGGSAENGNWPTHVHVQLILDMGENTSNYPGVCKPSEADSYLKNCPDPSRFIGLPKPNNNTAGQERKTAQHNWDEYAIN